MNAFGFQCPTCPDTLSVMTAKSAKFSVVVPSSGEALKDVDHTGPTVVAPPGHVMIIHRGHGEAVKVGENEIVSLCSGDVVRVLPRPEE